MPLLDAPRDQQRARPSSLPEHIPELQNGDRLSHEEFMRRYEAMPETRAQLVAGSVFIRGRVPFVHGESHASITGWIGHYAAQHPNLILGSGCTVLLDDADVVEPDVLLMRPFAQSGRAQVGSDGYVHGPPELVVEVAASTASLDANAKAEAYHAAGVKEYLLWRTEEERIDWYERSDDRYLAMSPDANGLVESKLFPGLILNPAALLRGDLATVLSHVSP
jgi:Uma2 family endonuclease